MIRTAPTGRRLLRASLAALLTALCPLVVLTACSGGTQSAPGGPPFLGAAVVGATQDRDYDPSGATLVIEFDGAMNTDDVETTSYYGVTSAAVTAAVQIEPTRVRLSLTAAVLPGATLVTVQSGMRDASGQASAGAVGHAIESTDTDPPQAARIAGVTVSGLNNDQATVEFDDLMVTSDVVRVDSWNLESPAGTPVDLERAIIEYDEEAQCATITLGGGQNLTTGASISAVLTTMRDVGGNRIESSSFGSSAVTSFVVGDRVAPRLLSVYPGETANTLRFVFDEPVQFTATSDLVANMPVSGTRVTFAESTSPGIDLQPNASVSLLGALVAEVTFAVAPEAGDLANIAGVADLAGNVIVPRAAVTVEERDQGGPELFVGSTELIAFEGERNDIFRITFDRALHPDGLYYDYRYGLLENFFVNTLGAKGTFDGDREVTFLLRGPVDHEVQTANTYLLAVAQIMSVQGVPIDMTTYEYTVTPTGDAVAPSLTAARISSTEATRLLVEFSEALAVTQGSDPTQYSLDGSAPTATEFVSPRVMALTFSQAPTIGQTLSVTTVALRDRAGNRAALTADVTVQGSDTTPPSVASITATAQAGTEPDLIVIQFSELVDPASLNDPEAIHATVAGSTVSLIGSELFYQSANNTLTAELPDTLLLPFGESVTVEIASFTDAAGNESIGQSGAATIGGDQTAPGSLVAFVNYREDVTGTVVEVTPDEPLRTSATGTMAWSASGGQSVLSVSSLGFDRYRLTLGAPLGANDTLTLTGATDLAGNVAGGPLVVNPIE